MKKKYLMGLPTPVSAPRRITLDKKLCYLHGIPTDGNVCMSVDGPVLRISPFPHKGSELKSISARRVTLPTEWAESRGISFGDYIYQLGTLDGIMIYASDFGVGENANSKQETILGLPLKIARDQIYFPRTYLDRYGFIYARNKAILETRGGLLTYRPFINRPLTEQERVVTLSNGLTSLPATWRKEQNLTDGSIVFLVGQPDGLMVHTADTAIRKTL